MNRVGRWMRGLWLRLRPSARRRDGELDEELQYHADRLVEEFRARGLPDAEARLAARREFGAVAVQKDACRDARGWTIAGEWARHTRFAARALGRSPGYTIVSLTSLTCGLTLAAVTIALVDAYLHRTLPFPSSERLYHVNYADAGQQEPGDLASVDWSAVHDLVEAVDRSTATRFYVTDETATRELQGLLVSTDVIDMLGISSVAGRGLDSADFRPDAERVVLIGHALWRDRFGSSPDAVGQLLRASSGDQTRPAELYRIVGILPSGFRYARNYARTEIDLVTPARDPAPSYMVRLRPHAPAELVAQRITEQVLRLPDVVSGRSRAMVRLEGVHDRYVGELRPVLRAIAVAVVLAALVVLANVAILTLLRIMHRQKEVAVRLALGASTRQILAYLVAEASLLALTASAAAALLTAILLAALGPAIETQLGRPAPGGAHAMGVDTHVFLVLSALGLLVILVLSAVPAMTVWHPGLATRLRLDQRVVGDNRAARFARGALIAVEVAGTFALLVGSGLMVRSVVNIVGTDLGIGPAGVLRTRLALPATPYGDAASLSRFYARFLDDVGEHFGGAVAVMSNPVFAPPPQQRLETDTGATWNVGVRSVSPGYFAVLGMHVGQGRAFNAGDRVDSEPVAIVGESLARRLWPRDGALGQRIRTGERPVANAESGEWRRVVGVVSDVRQSFLDRDSDDVYLPFLQTASQYAPVIARTRTTLAADGDILRRVVADIDRSVLVGPVVSLAQEAAQETAGARFLAALLTACSGFAAMIAMIGLYGVTAYTVHQQERALGVRLALGATPWGIVRQQLRRTTGLVAAGVILGIPGAFLFTRVIQHQLFGVSPLDSATLGGAGLLLVAGSVLAVWVPVSRVSRRSPAWVLRGD
jgi:predicted permease